MKTGIIRRIDDLGRIAIPKEIRRSLQIHENDPLEIRVDGGGIHLTKYTATDEYVPVLDKIIEDIDSDTFFDADERERIIFALRSAVRQIADCVERG